MKDAPALQEAWRRPKTDEPRRRGELYFKWLNCQLHDNYNLWQRYARHKRPSMAAQKILWRGTTPAWRARIKGSEDGVLIQGRLGAQSTGQPSPPKA